MPRPLPSFLMVLSAAALSAAPGAAAAEEALGRVSAVSGEVTAQLPGEEPRALHCGDPVYAGDTVRTAQASRVGIQSEDVRTQLAAASRLRLEGREEALAATLEEGRVRMLDPRDAGVPARLAALDIAAEIAGNDVEAYIFAEKAGPYAMLCEWDAGLPVARSADEELEAAPGECVISKPAEPLYTARAHDARIPVAAADVCEIDPAQLAALAGAPSLHLSPSDVAAPPPVAGVGTAGLGSHSPQGAQMPERTPCDNPGSGCFSPVPVVGQAGGPVGGGGGGLPGIP